MFMTADKPLNHCEMGARNESSGGFFDILLPPFTQDSRISQDFQDFQDTGDQRSHLQVALIFALLIFFSVATILGNALVIIAVAREEFLHSPTNYFIVSLAFADCAMGLIVMPFEALTEFLHRTWIFGPLWCDLWRAMDVLLATASILNLCVISLDRYWAISSPFSYPRRMTSTTAGKLIAVVWLTSAALSFPFILYWRAMRPEPLPPGVCTFTDDALYLIGSSLLSFYLPLVVMLTTYFRIYRAAMRQKRSIKLGSKFLQDNDREVHLRIHRGGRSHRATPPSPNSSLLSHISQSIFNSKPRSAVKSTEDEDAEGAAEEFLGGIASATVMTTMRMAVCPGMMRGAAGAVMKGPSRGSIFRRKLSKLAKEKKAAKTLAIVLGVFILCWLPFFVLNLAAALCPSCAVQHSLLFSIATWLGWVNSSMNPVIYAARNPDFRRAFGRVFCCCKHPN